MEDYQYLLTFLFILLVFVPVTLQAYRRRNLKPPPMAANDRKLYRLWRSDPDAYARKYAELDKQYLAAQKDKEN